MILSVRVPLGLCTALLAVAGVRAASITDLDGTWITHDGRARVRLERCGTKRDRVCGYIVWSNTSFDAEGKLRLDTHNPDPSKRARAVLGHQLFMGLAPATQGQFSGRVYNADDGRFYDVRLWREGDQLNLKGCLLPLLCKTESWARTNDVAPGELTGPTGQIHGPVADREWAQSAPKRVR